MATADIEDHLSERDWGNKLFSKQFCAQLRAKVVNLDGVVKKFSDYKTISVAERQSLFFKKVAGDKIRQLLTIIIDHCKRNDFQAFQTFIDILGDTNNIDIAQQLSLICKEWVHSAAIQSRLTKEKSLVRNLRNEISRLEEILKEKERDIKGLTDENKKLVDKLTRNKNDLEKLANLKSNVICKKEKEIVEEERKMSEAIEESNRLHLNIDTLQQQHSKAKMQNKEEMSKKIKILEDEIAEKENTIMNLRKNKTMTREEIEKEFGNITKGQEKILDDLNEKFDALAKAKMVSEKQHNERYDVLEEKLTRVLNLLEKK